MFSLNAEATPGRRFSIPERFYVLDVARGGAALTVVFYHWVHFFYLGTSKGEFHRESQPFFAQLGLVYAYGNKAVDFFFALSGFIFYWLYSSRIGGGKVTATDFGAYRLSRLYPLHLATLLLVLALQWAYMARHSSYFVYGPQDLRHFVLNLLFASAWGWQKSLSFNGPSWSISVEVLLYILFFASCRLGWKSWWQLLVFAALGRVVLWAGQDDVGRGMMGFFQGGLVFSTYRRLLETSRFEVWARLAVVVAIVAWSVTIAIACLGLADTTVLSRVSRITFLVFVIPMTVLALVLLETLREAFARRLDFLGELSYSTYLIHFPLQLVFILLAESLGYGRAVFYRPEAMLLFFAVLIPLSFASYHWFERPLQDALRRLYKAGKRSAGFLLYAPRG